jgi:hypothetical protein
MDFHHFIVLASSSPIRPQNRERLLQKSKKIARQINSLSVSSI